MRQRCRPPISYNQRATARTSAKRKAQRAGLNGVLAPSAALGGETTLVVIAHALAKITAEHSQVQRPPIRMVDTLERLHLPEGAIDSIARLYQVLTGLARRLGRAPRN